MKLNIAGNVVNITVKSPTSHEANTKDTMDFLNLLSIYLTDCADYNQTAGYKGFADDSRTMADDIYKALVKAGAYD